MSGAGMMMEESAGAEGIETLAEIVDRLVPPSPIERALREARAEVISLIDKSKTTTLEPHDFHELRRILGRLSR